MKNNLVNIVSCNYSRAILLKALLDSEDIESYLTDVNLIQADISAGVNVFVKEKDMDKALKIVNDFTKEYYSDKEDTVKKIQKINKILVPVDFSESSFNACLYALKMAKMLKSELKLLHVYYNPATVAASFPDSFSYQIGEGDIFQDVETAIKKSIKDYKEKLLKLLTEDEKEFFKISTSIEYGLPEDELLEFIKKYKPGFIVLGTQGQNQKNEKLVGSFALKIIEKSKFPVLSIPAEASFKDSDKLNILYATDFNDNDFSAFRKLMSIVSPFDISVKCIHIGDSKKDAFDSYKMDNLKQQLEKSYKSFNVECFLIQGKDEAASINKFIETHNINFLAITSKRRNYMEKLFTPNITKQILFHTKVPLLVFNF
jgi:nucleotide-binding universal stress UspA family protein